jgi:N utilization substance protein B
MARRRARQHALQMLFQWDLRRTDTEEIIMGYYGSLLVAEVGDPKPRPDIWAESLFRGTVSRVEELDEIITRHAENWKIQRMPAVDRNLLRLAVYEMSRTDTPPPVAIDEALELARRFSGEESVHFINGVLDAVRKELAQTSAAS